MKANLWLIAVAILTLGACGGGGGSSNTPAVGGGSGGGGTGGGTGGGGTGGGTGTPNIPAISGPAAGGIAIAIDVGSVGIELDVAVGGTGMSIGDVQGLGSIIMNGVTIDTDSAEFFIEGGPGSLTDLRQGQQVFVVGDDDVAAGVFYRANVKGPVTAITVVDPLLGRATIDVLGQSVTTNATTSFADVGLVDIAVGDLLEISGTLDETGAVNATYVELETSLSEYKVLGVVTSLTGDTFALGGLTVDFGSATLEEFDGAALADGDIVEVRGAVGNFTAPADFVADQVERLPIAVVGGDAVARVEGFIERFDGLDDFEVQSTPIATDASTVFINGDADDIDVGTKVQIEGVADGDGSVLAASVTIQPTQTIRAEGNIEAIDTVARTVTVLGVEFVVRDTSRFEDDSSTGLDPLTLADLGIADEIEIRGYLDGATPVITQLEREDPEDRAELRGPVTAEDAFAGTLSILGVPIRGETGITEYEDADDNVLTQAEFHAVIGVNDFVRARWDVFSSTDEIADQLSLEDD